MISTSKSTLVPTGTWSVDPIHSTVGFSVKHLGIATVRGKFEDFEGTLEIGEGDETAPRIRHGAGRLHQHRPTAGVTTISARPTSSTSSTHPELPLHVHSVTPGRHETSRSSAT